MSLARWHDVECGSYDADLELWRALAAEHPGKLLDVGAGTGRVSLDLARRGHEVTALDLHGELLEELKSRAGELPVTVVQADARDFSLPHRFRLCLVPMQTVQLLGGPDGRQSFLDCARRHLEPGGILAMAIVDGLEAFELRPGAAGPLPDVAEHDGTLFWSQPTGVQVDADGYVLERRRETVAPDGTREVTEDRIRLDRVSAAELEREGRTSGMRIARRHRIRSDGDYVGSEVVMLVA